MSLLENFTKKVAETAKTAAKKSGEIVEITKLNINIATEEEKIEKILVEIGRKVYNEYIEVGDIDEQFRSYCEQIKVHESNIKDIRKKILEVKNAKVCQVCKSEIDSGAVYCPKCGNKQEKNIEYTVIEKNVCQQCGAKIEQGCSFCTQCGTKI